MIRHHKDNHYSRKTIPIDRDGFISGSSPEREQPSEAAENDKSMTAGKTAGRCGLKPYSATPWEGTRNDKSKIAMTTAKERRPSERRIPVNR